MKIIKALCVVFAIAFMITLTACEVVENGGEVVNDAENGGIDYLALVNKQNKLPDDWEENLKTVTVKNSLGDDVEVEEKAYAAYLELKEALEKEGVKVDLDSARRSVAEQQRIMDEFTEEYGADYAQKTVAKPGYSEHHTGLALDLYLNVNGEDVYLNEDMTEYPEIWEKIHAKLADYGFILRYLEGKEHITGYGYEPWHIRYIDDVKAAKEIKEKGITLEGYLKAAVETEPEIDYGSSALFTQEELKEAVIQIKCRYAFFPGCELISVRYAGDDTDNASELERINAEATDGTVYTHVVKFLMDFKTLDECGEVLQPNRDYNDYNWWLASKKDGGWEIITFGY